MTEFLIRLGDMVCVDYDAIKVCVV